MPSPENGTLAAPGIADPCQRLITGVGIACTAAESFTTEGRWTAIDGPDDYTILLVPEGTEIGDIDEGLVHPSGVAVSFKGVYEDVTLNNGRVAEPRQHAGSVVGRSDAFGWFCGLSVSGA